MTDSEPLPPSPSGASPDGRFPILVVDDDPCFLETCFLALTFTDCVLHTAVSGAEAMVELEKRDYAAVLLDVYMQGMDGFQLARWMRANPRTRQTPILFITGICQTEDDVAKGYTLGAVDYLFKPFRIVALQSKVSAFLEAYRQRKLLEDKELELVALRAKLADLEHRREPVGNDPRRVPPAATPGDTAASPGAARGEGSSMPAPVPGAPAEKRLLRLCASCQKIRTKDGRWLVVLDYVEQEEHAVFSHGVCPDCFQRLYPGFEDLLPSGVQAKP